MAALISYRFTYNNYSSEGEGALKDWLKENTKYAVFGHEVAPSTGTPHLQGYFALKKKQRIITLQNKLTKKGINLALLRADASASANRDYAVKDRTGIFEHGEIKICGQGTRTDLKRVCEEIKEGKPLKKIAADNSCEWIKYNRGIASLKHILDEDRIPDERDLTVTLLYGDAGSGKTRAARDFAIKYKKTYYFVLNPNGGNLWWDGYEGQEVIIIDDFKSWIPYHLFLRMLDVYKLQLAVKGSYCWAAFKYVFITSNVPWEQWYNTKGDLYGYCPEALERRIHNVFMYSQKYPDTEIVVSKFEKGGEMGDFTRDKEGDKDGDSTTEEYSH